MRNFYSLRINCNPKCNAELITIILKVNPTNSDNDLWELELIETEDDPYIDFINYFLDIMEGKYHELQKIGIEKEYISVWQLYEYDAQCNMEFSPHVMKRIGENGITLCISCWEKGSVIDLESIKVKSDEKSAKKRTSFKLLRGNK